MPLFRVWKKFPFATLHLQQYFMCHRVWAAAMPYKVVEITPEQKYRWNWRIKDSINFVLFKWSFEHTFTSVQEQHKDHLFIKFEKSNQVDDFTGKILFQEQHCISFLFPISPLAYLPLFSARKLGLPQKAVRLDAKHYRLICPH